MKKSLLIIALCVIQSACAAVPETVSQDDALLSYADLANEITVGYVNIADRQADSATDDDPVDTP